MFEPHSIVRQVAVPAGIGVLIWLEMQKYRQRMRRGETTLVQFRHQRRLAVALWLLLTGLWLIVVSFVAIGVAALAIGLLLPLVSDVIRHHQSTEKPPAA